MFKIFVFVSSVMLGAKEIEFRTFISYSILIHAFCWLDTGENVDLYVVKPIIYQAPESVMMN